MNNNILSTIYYFSKKYKWSILISIIVYYIIGDFLSLIVNPYIFKEIINKLAQDTFAFHKDYWYFLLFTFTINSRILLSSIITKFEYNFTVNLKEDIKNHYFQRIIKNSIGFFNDNMAGTLNSKIATISNNIVYIIESISSLISISVSAVVLAIMFLKINYVLSLILLVWFIFYSTGYIIFMKKIEDKAQANSHVENESYGKLTDLFVNALSVKIFSRESFEKSNIKKESIKIKKEKTNFYITLTYQKIFDYLGMLLLILPVLYISINMVIRKQIIIGDLVFINVTFSQVMWYLQYLSRQFIRLSEMVGEIRDSLEVINSLPDINNSPKAQRIILGKAPEIIFENVSFKYKQNLPTVFNNFNLTINPKQKVGIVGYTGSGKSTFVNLLLRFYDVTSGKIIINDHNIMEDFTQLSLRQNISYIPQEPILFHRTIKENIRYGNIHATEEQLIEATKKAYCYDFIMELEKGFDTLVGERGVKLSGGQKQRITIARAILKNSPILILDEATSALDSITEKYIQKALNNLMENKTVIAIAHRLSTLNNMDRIIVLDKGKIAEDGTRDELLRIKDGIFKNMWEMQKEGIINSIEINNE